MDLKQPFAALCWAVLGWAVLQMVEETEGASGVIFAYLVTAVGEALRVCRESVLLTKYYFVCFSAAVVEQIPVQLHIKQSRDQWSRGPPTHSRPPLQQPVLCMGSPFPHSLHQHACRLHHYMVPCSLYQHSRRMHTDICHITRC